MTLSTFVGRVLGALAQTDIPHMVTGSLAASFYGEPRSTQDVDLVVEVPATRLDPLCAAFLELGFYVSPEAAAEAVRESGQFNVIDADSGWKADLIIRKPRPFSESEFERRRAVQILGHDTFLVSPEDLIIAKLEWAQLGYSERQLLDVAAIVQVQGTDLDSEYIALWTDRLGLGELWNRVQSDLA